MCWAKIWHAYFQQVTLVTGHRMVWTNSTCWKFKKKAFSGWWCRIDSHHCGQSFCCTPQVFAAAPFYPGSGSVTLQPHSRVWLIHNRAVLLGETKSFQHEHVCQNCKIVVKQNVWWCWVLDDNVCMWRRIVTLSGVFTN